MGDKTIHSGANVHVMSRCILEYAICHQQVLVEIMPLGRPTIEPSFVQTGMERAERKILLRRLAFEFRIIPQKGGQAAQKDKQGDPFD